MSLHIHKYKVIKESEVENYGGLMNENIENGLVDVIWMPKEGETNKSKKKIFEELFKDYTFSSDKLVLDYVLDEEHVCLYVVVLDHQRNRIYDQFFDNVLLSITDPESYDDMNFYITDNEELQRSKSWAFEDSPIMSWDLKENEIIYFYW